MKSLVSWVVIVAILISTFPRTVVAIEPPPWFEGPDPNAPVPTAPEVTPVMGGLQETMTANKLGVVAATVPFVDQSGRLFDFKIDFPTRRYQIVDSTGFVHGTGIVSEAQARGLEAAIKEHRSTNAVLATTTDAAAKPGLLAVLALVAAIIAAVIAYLAYQHSIRAEDNANSQFEQMCQSQALNASAANYASAQARCPMRVFPRGGQMCTEAPRETRAAFGCTGAEYGCVIVCG